MIGTKEVMENEKNLKSIIELTLHWIESEIRTQKLLEDMPEFR